MANRRRPRFISKSRVLFDDPAPPDNPPSFSAPHILGGVRKPSKFARHTRPAFRPRDVSPVDEQSVGDAVTSSCSSILPRHARASTPKDNSSGVTSAAYLSYNKRFAEAEAHALHCETEGKSVAPTSCLTDDRSTEEDIMPDRVCPTPKETRASPEITNAAIGRQDYRQSPLQSSNNAVGGPVETSTPARPRAKNGRKRGVGMPIVEDDENVEPAEAMNISSISHHSSVADSPPAVVRSPAPNAVNPKMAHLRKAYNAFSPSRQQAIGIKSMLLQGTSSKRTIGTPTTTSGTPMIASGTPKIVIGTPTTADKTKSDSDMFAFMNSPVASPNCNVDVDALTSFMAKSTLNDVFTNDGVDSPPRSVRPARKSTADVGASRRTTDVTSPMSDNRLLPHSPLHSPFRHSKLLNSPSARSPDRSPSSADRPPSSTAAESDEGDLSLASDVDTTTGTQRTGIATRMDLDADVSAAYYLPADVRLGDCPLDELLHICEQAQLLDWNDLLTTRSRAPGGIRKLGEGAYGEVFLVHTNACVDDDDRVAIKIIPVDGKTHMNGEPQKDAEEVIPEVLIARELSTMSDPSAHEFTADNFCDVRCVNVVQGCYPSLILDAWDTWKEDSANDAVNDRPSVLPEDQIFLVFQFGNGGADLDNYKIRTVEEAQSILAQVVVTMAAAERELEFEHRDLHVGNVLIKRTEETFLDYQTADGVFRLKTHGVHARIIDFTNSRMYKRGCTLFSDLARDEEIFAGPDDELQFEVYRAMRDYNNNEWKDYTPQTNVVWTHYLVNKLSDRNCAKFYAKGAKIRGKKLNVLKEFAASLIAVQAEYATRAATGDTTYVPSCSMLLHCSLPPTAALFATCNVDEAMMEKMKIDE